MAVNWYKVLKIVGCVFCLFFAIPIRVQEENRHGDAHHLFKAFVDQHNKSYANNMTEYNTRFMNFKKSLDVIDALNADRTKGSALYGITRFSDLSPEEFKETHLKRMLRRKSRVHYAPRIRRAALPLPEKIDWRLKNVVTPVRDQKLCGACWAFSTIETIESMTAIKNGTLEKLSVQQMIDCAQNGNLGCDGGDASLLLEWLLSNKIKLEKDADYPYKQETESCAYVPSKGRVQVASYSCKNAIGSEEAVLYQLANHGPVAVAVNAGNWQYYLGGIVQHHCPGSIDDLNHAAQIVGYVSNVPQPYYIVRNSWGTDFGLKGYLHLSYGQNMCGIAQEVCSIDVL